MRLLGTAKALPVFTLKIAQSSSSDEHPDYRNNHQLQIADDNRVAHGLLMACLTEFRVP